MKRGKPVVAIVGRQNVGKSSLFNRLVGRKAAIVDSRPGTTLDRLEADCNLRGRACLLVDTGGLGFAPEDPYGEEVESQIAFALAEADAVVLLGDLPTGVTGTERSLAERLRRAGKPVLLVVNKVDHPAREAEAAEFYRLGLGDPVLVSVTHDRGIELLEMRLAALLPATEERPRETGPRIAIVGQRNVGKSTLINALCGEPRVVVSERPGTTRDTVDVWIRKWNQTLVLVDTAGVRKRTKVEDSVELASLRRTEQALSRADGVLFLLEAQRPISRLEKELARRIVNSFRPVVIALNKWDRVPEAKRNVEKFGAYVYRVLPHLSFAPLAILSAKDGFNVWEPLKTLLELVRSSRLRVTTGEMNRLISEATRSAPPPVRGSQEGRILFATQISVSPPTLVFFCKNPNVFGRAYRKHLEEKVRDLLPFREIPVRIVIRGKGRRRRAGGRARDASENGKSISPAPPSSPPSAAAARGAEGGAR